MCALPFRRELSDKEIFLAKETVKPFSAAIAAAREKAGADAVTLAWVSDLHLHARRDYPQLTGDAFEVYGKRGDTSVNLRLAFAEIDALQPAPDLLIFGGDIVDYSWGGNDELDGYDEFKNILDAHLTKNLPTLPLLGNHDHDKPGLSDAFLSRFTKLSRADWPQSAAREDFYYETIRNGWRFVAIDSTGRPLTETQRAWLTERMNAADAPPTVVLVHRPFVCVGNWVDNIRLRDAKSFDVIDSSKSVRLVMSGHTHKARAWQYRRKIHAVFLALAYGIGDVCGWGVVVLGKSGVHSIFVKEIRGKVYETVIGRDVEQQGNFRKLEIPLYEDSELCDPCSQPKRLDPALRD